MPDRVERLEVGSQASERVTLERPVLTALISGEREKRRDVALSVIPPRVVQAVLAIEDRRFYAHPGVDPIGVVGAVFSYFSGRRGYLAGGSTITQQLVRNVFLPKFEGMTLQSARARSLRRKALEIFVSLVLTSRASKDEILELYLNNIPLGQRGSFAISGVPEAARLFFGKDVSNLSIAEAATIAGVIQSPSALSPFNNAARCKERRNVVLQAMADEVYITADDAQHASREPLGVVQRALEAEAPNFVDFVGQTLAESYPGLTTTTNQAVDVHTTLDLHLQRLAQDAVRDGLLNVDQLLSRRKRRGKAEAALIAVDPKTGEILALVGGRSYNQSQYNRAIASRRQPGSVFKPFVYLTAFEQAAEHGQTDITAGHHRRRRSRDVRIRRSGVDARELREDLRRPDHLSSCARPLEKPGDHSRRPGRRLRSRRRAVEEGRRRHGPQSVSVDRARRVRGDAVRNRHRLHAVSESGPDAPPPAHPHDHERRQERHQESDGRCRGGSPAPRRASSSPT